ncbi:MAG: hypothetical protein DCC52_12845 [Chloroflexi bacterium]|nr:MAG: hypothetical protein DCC52_12845 [Chloroflexota bacterium]
MLTDIVPPKLVLVVYALLTLRSIAAVGSETRISLSFDQVLREFQHGCAKKFCGNALALQAWRFDPLTRRVSTILRNVSC